MAYIGADDVKRIRDTLKTTYPNLKFSVTKSRGSLGVDVAIMAGNICFDELFRTDEMGGGETTSLRRHIQLNPFYPEYYGSHEDLIREIVTIIKTAPEKKYYDNSDPMTDYFDTAFYFHVEIGKWDRPYEFRP